MSERSDAPMVRYSMFRVYGYFYNLIIYRIMINTLICNPISVIVKV